MVLVTPQLPANSEIVRVDTFWKGKIMSIINRIHARFHRPENGYDPVSKVHAAAYFDREWLNGIDENLIDQLNEQCHGLVGKRVLDLGGGPGHYSIAMAKRGAIVTWYDLSNNYREMAEAKAVEHGVSLNYVIGYLDDARTLLQGDFDLVFCRVCFYYGFSDSTFAKVIGSLIHPQGCGYIDTHNSSWKRNEISLSFTLRTMLNDYFSFKIGHPHPPQGRLEKLFRGMGFKVITDYSVQGYDKVLFFK